ncbi:MAG: histidine kinase [Thermodesulfobacteriota bacterium]
MGTAMLLFFVIIIVVAVVISHKRLISAQRDKLEIIQKSEKKYRILIESMQEAAFIVDNKRKILFANSRFCQLMAIVRENILGKNILDLITSKDSTKLLNSIDHVFLTGIIKILIHSFHLVSKSCCLETTFVPQYDDHSNIISVMAISRDTTKRKLMEDQLKDLVRTLQDQQAMLKTLSSEVIKAQEKERARISRELHDEIGQTLTAISLNLEMINKQGYSGKEELTKWITDCKKLVHRTMENIHRFSYDLRPSVLDNLGLLPAIRSHIRGFSKRTGIDVEMEDDGAVKKLDEEIKTILYRVMQEALNNVAKHSSAHKVCINISKEKNSILLRITDDGIGFDPDELSSIKPEKGGLGLLGIRERVGVVGGNLSITSKQNSGTILKVDIPFGEA